MPAIIYPPKCIRKVRIIHVSAQVTRYGQFGGQPADSGDQLCQPVEIHLDGTGGVPGTL
ncbi:hypothetical protein [Jatrophihabitans sp.]|uniref:hypothetical protein n=1 Tax=Jatrophihabitans sp. TaxID=1932789 RepID=UPI002C9B5378|nr:hypothetical protein [Jatrophihabitans sp.]